MALVLVVSIVVLAIFSFMRSMFMSKFNSVATFVVARIVIDMVAALVATAFLVVVRIAITVDDVIVVFNVSQQRGPKVSKCGGSRVWKPVAWSGGSVVSRYCGCVVRTSVVFCVAVMCWCSVLPRRS